MVLDALEQPVPAGPQAQAEHPERGRPLPEQREREGGGVLAGPLGDHLPDRPADRLGAGLGRDRAAGDPAEHGDRHRARQRQDRGEGGQPGREAAQHAVRRAPAGERDEPQERVDDQDVADVEQQPVGQPEQEQPRSRRR